MTVAGVESHFAGDKKLVKLDENQIKEVSAAFRMAGSIAGERAFWEHCYKNWKEGISETRKREIIESKSVMFIFFGSIVVMVLQRVEFQARTLEHFAQNQMECVNSHLAIDLNAV